MKKLLLLTLSLLCLADIVRAQEEDTKTRINRIKRDTSYLYGEATMPSREEAMTLAKDFLRSYIEQWIAETRDTQTIRSVVARDLVADCEELSLMRGDMFRAFAYVHKSDLYAVDTKAVSIPVTAPSEAESGRGGEVPAEAGAAAETPVAVTDGAQPRDARPDPALLAAGTAASEPPVPAAAEGAGSVPEPMPSEDAAASERAFYDQLVRDLCGMQSRPEIERLLRSETYASACTFGEVGYATRPQDIEKGILVIYKPGSNVISALLSPKSPKRTNLKTAAEDSTVNYPGCRAMWICLK